MASGRALRRLDAVATGFEAWYRALHVLQWGGGGGWGGAMGVFTTLLYSVSAGVYFRLFSLTKTQHGFVLTCGGKDVLSDGGSRPTVPSGDGCLRNGD